MKTTYMLLTLNHVKDLPSDITDIVAGRVWTLDKVEGSEARLLEPQEVELLKEKEE